MPRNGRRTEGEFRCYTCGRDYKNSRSLSAHYDAEPTHATRAALASKQVGRKVKKATLGIIRFHKNTNLSTYINEDVYNA